MLNKGQHNVFFFFSTTTFHYPTVFKPTIDISAFTIVFNQSGRIEYTLETWFKKKKSHWLFYLLLCSFLLSNTSLESLAFLGWLVWVLAILPSYLQSSSTAPGSLFFFFWHAEMYVHWLSFNEVEKVIFSIEDIYSLDIHIISLNY